MRLYLLRYWLADAVIDPDRDVQLRVVPPPLMAAHMEAGWIDGYCVGEPWNSAAVTPVPGCSSPMARPLPWDPIGFSTAGVSIRHA